MFGRLADVFADHAREVDAVEIELKFGGDDLRGHRLARAGITGEECGEARAAREEPSRLRVLPKLRAFLRFVGEIAKRLDGRRLEHDVFPAKAAREEAGQARRGRCEWLPCASSAASAAVAAPRLPIATIWPA